MTTTTKAHLHAVLQLIDAHLDDTAAALTGVSIRGGHVSIETTAGDLPTLALALGLGALATEPWLIASGADFAVVPRSASGVFDGSPLRVWAPVVMPIAEYLALPGRAARAH